MFDGQELTRRNDSLTAKAGKYGQHDPRIGQQPEKRTHRQWKKSYESSGLSVQQVECPPRRDTQTGQAGIESGRCDQEPYDLSP